MNDFLFPLMILIIGLLLAVPIGIAVNLLTPKARSRLALRSTQKIQQRILLLEESVEQTERMIGEPTFAVAEFAKLAVQVVAADMVVLILLPLLLYLGLVLRVLLPVPGIINPATRYVVAGLGSLVVGGVVGYTLSRPLSNLRAAYRRVIKYEKWRQATLDEIEELKRRLPQTEVRSLTQDGAEADLPEPTPQGELVIHRATFGIGPATVDVTGIIKSAVSGGRVVILATPPRMGSDPAVGLVKELVVSYSHAGQRHTTRVQEGCILELPEDQDQVQE